MNKVAIGCLGAVLVFGVGGAVGAYYFLWRPAKAYVGEFAKLKEIPRLNQQVTKTAAFTPPAGNELTGEVVDRFVRTQKDIQTKMGQRLEELSAKYRTIGQSLDAGRRPTWAEITGAYKDVAGLILDAKRAQVEALNQNNFSVAEYDWTRQRIYEAAGIPINADFEKILKSIAEGTASDQENRPPAATGTAPLVPEKNRTLVAPHTKELGERAVLAAFGL